MLLIGELIPPPPPSLFSEGLAAILIWMASLNHLSSTAIKDLGTYGTINIYMVVIRIVSVYMPRHVRCGGAMFPGDVSCVLEILF